MSPEHSLGAFWIAKYSQRSNTLGQHIIGVMTLRGCGAAQWGMRSFV